MPARVMRFDAPAAHGHVITTRSDGGHVIDDAREEMKRRNGTSAPPAETPREDKDETPIARARREMIERNAKRFAVDANNGAGPRRKTPEEEAAHSDPNTYRAVQTAARTGSEDINDRTRELAAAVAHTFSRTTKTKGDTTDERAEMVQRQNERFAVK